VLRVGIVGGRLQGLEAVYLAKQAGFEVAVIDKDPLVPAAALVDEFYNLDLIGGGLSAKALVTEFDLILPATENYEVLVWLKKAARQHNVPLAFDLQAYNISSSKKKSNRLFTMAGIPIPEQWPGCDFPVIVKPSNLSGSRGVERVDDQDYLRALMNRLGDDIVIEKYLAGPSYSLEIIADKGKCVELQVTELNFDRGFDCKRVIAGPNTGRKADEALREIGKRISSVLNLSGIMDIEVIETDNGLKVLEIDARLPSQTPSAVYHSTGVNMVSLLADYWVDGRLPARGKLFGGDCRAVIYEHLRFRRGTLEVAGEHILTDARNLKIYKDMFTADVMISNFAETSQEWVATLIFTDETEMAVWEKRNRAIDAICRSFYANRFIDPEPFGEGGVDYDQIIL